MRRSVLALVFIFALGAISLTGFSQEKGGDDELLESWMQYDHLFQGGRGPHKIKISPYDPQHYVWVVDDTRHQILKFTNDGKELVMTLGEAGVPGNDENHFARPTDLAWLP